MANSRRRKKKKYNSFLILLLLILAVVLIAFFIQKGKQDNKINNEIINITTSNNSSENTAEANNKKEEKKPSIVESLSNEEIEQSKKRGLPVLMYHFFYDASAGEVGRDNNYMEIHDFEEQVKYLSDNGYYVPTWDEVLGYIDGKNGLPLKSVVITVDDGNESFFRLAVPILEKYNFKATSFLITCLCANRVTDNPVIDFQSHSHDMHKAGSDGKGAFLTLDYDSACRDLNISRSIIGETCTVFCYPFGHYNNTCKKILKDCNYILAFTTKGGRVFPGDDPLELPRVRMSKGDSLNAFISKVK